MIFVNNIFRISSDRMIVTHLKNTIIKTYIGRYVQNIEIHITKCMRYI